MRADLPPVPEEATSVATEVYRHWRDNALAHVVVGRVLAAALPHLYAAALRHAADRVEAKYPRDVEHLDLAEVVQRRTARMVCAQLRHMADEAVQG